jgi:hypothetical protein
MEMIQKSVYRLTLWSCALGLLAGIAVAQENFRPAVFAGLTIGKSTLKDAQQKLGKPADTSQDKSGTYWVYDDIGAVPGMVELAAPAGSQVISYVTLYPKDLSINDAQKLFGTDFRVIRYASEPCLGDGEAGPLYESPTGASEFIVYARRGLALIRAGNRITQIQYRGQPIGSKQSRCKGTHPLQKKPRFELQYGADRRPSEI